MENKNQSSVFYSLNVNDIQTVAKQQIRRKLTDEEVEIIKKLAPTNVNWYDAIADAIREGIKEN